ncbi:hypothetical protein PV783_34105 [Chitinophaga sp. CC14]|uniref:hypothetical protein n=1 Tax=Chitinophaga sp. CC14 TaxID=3029199 RepID=UPI003B762B53
MENTNPPDTVRAICINPQAQTITDVLIPNNDSLEVVYKLLHCESVQLDVYAVEAPHYMYVDEEGMYNENCSFSLNGYVYYGAALIFCKALDEEKEYADCTLQLHSIIKGVVFYDQMQTAIEKATGLGNGHPANN